MMDGMLTWLAALVLAVSGERGDAAFSYRIEEAAQNRGIEYDGVGCALALDCSRVGEKVWIRVGAAWLPATVVDCGAAHDRAWLRKKDRVLDLPWSFWKALDLPLAPHPAEWSAHPPPHIPQ